MAKFAKKVAKNENPEPVAPQRFEALLANFEPIFINFLFFYIFYKKFENGQNF